MTSFSVNPYAAYHAPGSKEFIEVNTQAITRFKPTRKFRLRPDQGHEFVNDLESFAEQFAYLGHLRRVPTNATLNDPNDQTAITLSGHKNMLTTWNEISMDSLQRNSTLSWGNRTWTVTNDKSILELSAVRGEVTNGRLNTEGKLIFQQRQKLAWLAHQVLSLIEDDDRKMLTVNKSQYTWYCPVSGEAFQDGRIVLHLALNKL